MAEENFFGGVTLESNVMALRTFFRHGRLRGAKGGLA